MASGDTDTRESIPAFDSIRTESRRIGHPRLSCCCRDRGMRHNYLCWVLWALACDPAESAGGGSTAEVGSPVDVGPPSAPQPQDQDDGLTATDASVLARNN